MSDHLDSLVLDELRALDQAAPDADLSYRIRTEGDFIVALMDLATESTSF